MNGRYCSSSLLTAPGLGSGAARPSAFSRSARRFIRRFLSSFARGCLGSSSIFCLSRASLSSFFFSSSEDVGEGGTLRSCVDSMVSRSITITTSRGGWGGDKRGGRGGDQGTFTGGGAARAIRRDQGGTLGAQVIVVWWCFSVVWRCRLAKPQNDPCSKYLFCLSTFFPNSARPHKITTCLLPSAVSLFHSLRSHSRYRFPRCPPRGVFTVETTNVRRGTDQELHWEYMGLFRQEVKGSCASKVRARGAVTKSPINPERQASGQN